MRTWGRIYSAPDVWTWVEVDPDQNGDRTNIYRTTLIQVLLLNLSESPFWANYGIPAQPSVIQQIFPDFYMSRTQQFFAPFFASLIISKRQSPTPTYDVKIVTKQGARLNMEVAGNDRYQLSH